jgi:hypothetical protein
MAAEVLAWIEEVLGEPLPKGPFEDVLKDGIILCKLINKIAPDSVKKIQQKGTNFQLMENIQRYRKQFLYFFLYLGLTMLTCFFVKKSHGPYEVYEKWFNTTAAFSSCKHL